MLPSRSFRAFSILMPYELVLQQSHIDFGAPIQKLCYHHPHEHLIAVA